MMEILKVVSLRMISEEGRCSLRPHKGTHEDLLYYDIETDIERRLLSLVLKRLSCFRWFVDV